MRNPVLLALALVSLTGCVSPGLAMRKELRLYELTGSRLLRCQIGPGNERSKNRGTLLCTSPDGERFQGEWMRLRETSKESSASDSDDMSSLPGFNSRASGSNWDWAASLGVDLEKGGTRCIFLLYGDRGTVIDGIVVGETSDNEGLMGAAKDNKGRKYRVMG